MKHCLTIAMISMLLLSFSLFAVGAENQAAKVPDRVITQVKHPGWFKETFLDLADDLDEAMSADKKGLMLMFSTEGCSYCALFIDKSLGDPKLAAQTQQHFDVIGMEIFDDAEMTNFSGDATRVKDFAKKIGASMAPSLFFFSEDGQQIFKAVGYQNPQRYEAILDYLAAGHKNRAEFKQFLAARQPANPSNYTLKQDDLFHSPPYALDRSRFAASMPLLVIFEKDNCADCQQFHHETLAKKAVRKELKKFEVIRLDAADNATPVLAPNGQLTTAAKWYDSLEFSHLPAIAFFDEKGNNVIQTDALTQEGRMLNSAGFVLQKAYEKGWNYQRFARSQAIARNQAALAAGTGTATAQQP